MNTTPYRVFLKVVELNSITHAASALGYTQPAVSRMLNSIESQIGFPLLLRGNGSIILTEEGKELYTLFQQLIEAEDNLTKRISQYTQLTTGNLKIGSFYSFGSKILPSVLSEYSKMYPNVNITVREESRESSAYDLQHGKIHLSIMTDLKLNGFEFYPLLNDKLGIIVNKSNSLSKYKKVSISMLNNSKLLIPLDGWDDEFKLLQQYEQLHSSCDYNIACDWTAINFAANDLGVYIGGNLHNHNLPDNVVFIEFEEALQRTIGINIKSLKNASPSVREFVKLLQSVCQNA